MARGSATLEQMVRDLRLETRRSPNQNFGQDEYQALVRALQRTQNFLYWDTDWPFLRVRRDLILAQGQRYYDFPEDLNFERIACVEADGYGQWERLPRGISLDAYDVHDSDRGEQSSPALRWDVIHTGEKEQLEIWPVPSVDGEKVRFEGYKTLEPFVEDNDTCTLDDTLIVLFAAAELLAGQDDALASAKAEQARRLYRRMKGSAGYPTGGFYRLGGGYTHGTQPPARVIAVALEQGDG